MASDGRGVALGLSLGAALAAAPAFVPSTNLRPAPVAPGGVRASSSSSSGAPRSTTSLAAGALIGLVLAGRGPKLLKGTSRRATMKDTKMPKITEESFEEPDDDEVSKMKKKRKKNVAAFDPAKQLGVCEPLGFFDPLGFSPVGKRKNFLGLRTMEIKHGRIAMLACLGSVVQHFIHRPDVPADWPTYLGQVNPNGLGACALFYGTTGFFQLTGIVFAAMVIELFIWVDGAVAGDGREPGDYGNPLGIPLYTEDMRLKELNNGRMAMISISGIVAAELATGKDAIQQLTFWA